MSTANYIHRAADALVVQLPTLDAELLELYTLLVLIRGEQVSLRDVHDTWALWRNRTIPGHRSLIPFEQLAPEVQELDRGYVGAIAAAARAIA